MTRCNYCTLKTIKSRAAKGGLKVTILGDANWGMGGVNVYVHPENVDIKALAGGEDGERSKYRAAWFMELSKDCAC
jgi:hypothetical protein